MSRRAALSFRWALVAAVSGAIFWLSARSRLPDVGIHFEFMDKVEHAIAYAVWSFIFSMAARATWPRLGLAAGIAAAWLAGTCYGASDEFHQLFVPHRTADVMDLAADGAGALIGAIAHASWHYRKGRAPLPGAGAAAGTGATGRPR
jgi:VanZ family protein